MTDEFCKDSLESNMKEFSSTNRIMVQDSFKGRVFFITYADIIKEAFLKYYDSCGMALSNVVFNTETAAPAGKLEYSTIIKKESDCSEFIVASRTVSGEGGKCSPWVKNAKGIMGAAQTDCGTGINIKKKIAECKQDEITAAKLRNLYSDIFDFSLYRNETEAVVVFHIKKDRLKFIRGSIMRVCCLDYMLNLAARIFCDEKSKPVSCAKLLVGGELPQNVYMSVSKKSSDTADGKVKLSLVFCDENNKLIAEVDDLAMTMSKEALNRNAARLLDNPKAKTDAHGTGASSGKKHGNNIESLNHLTWREMDCYERAFGFLLGHKDERLTTLYKFFIGAYAGFDLKKLYPCIHDKSMISDILEILGYKVNTEIIDDPARLHTAIAEYIDSGKAVCALFDEYYIFYTKFYLRSHTDHVCTITNYDRARRLYSIIDHNHIAVQKKSTIINYGRFFCDFGVFEKIYSEREREKRFLMTLDCEGQKGEAVDEDSVEKTEKILKYLVQTSQAGGDTETICEYLKHGRQNFNADIIETLYTKLGKKELLIDTILNYFEIRDDKKDTVKDLSYQVIYNSNKLISIFIMNLYREKNADDGVYSELIKTIRNDTAKFFNEVLSCGARPM